MARTHQKVRFLPKGKQKHTAASAAKGVEDVLRIQTGTPITPNRVFDIIVPIDLPLKWIDPEMSPNASYEGRSLLDLHVTWAHSS
jgi:hypothetical protein